MIKLISKSKYDGEGRPFGSSTNPIKSLVICLSTDGTLPTTYTDIEGLDECAFAPGSICLDLDSKKTYIYDGTTFQEWG